MKIRTVGGVKLEPWLKAIPESNSHGSGTLQKRLWRVVSDYVRIRDWYAYKGQCIATGRYIPHWQEGNAGHFKAYSKCNGMFKFDERNIHLQSGSSNGWGDYDDWLLFEETMFKRTQLGKLHIDDLNRKTSLKFTNTDVVNKIKEILEKMVSLPEQPLYYQRVMSLK